MIDDEMKPRCIRVLELRQEGKRNSEIVSIIIDEYGIKYDDSRIARDVACGKRYENAVLRNRTYTSAQHLLDRLITIYAV